MSNNQDNDLDLYDIGRLDLLEQLRQDVECNFDVKNSEIWDYILAHYYGE